MSKRVVAVLLAVAGLSGCMDVRDRLDHADAYMGQKVATYDAAFHSWSTGRQPTDEEEQARRLLVSAKAGNASSQYMLGSIQMASAENTADRQEALAWLRRAATQDHADAQYALGEAYLNGQGVRSDPGTAATWFTKAAKNGQAQAQFMLANLYMTGRGVPTNRSAALEWYGRAADSGHPQAARYRDALKARVTADRL